MRIIAFFFVPLTLAGQFTFPPSVTVEDTRIPVFVDSTTTPPLANFRLHLEYQADGPVKLFQVGASEPITELPAGNSSADLYFESPPDQPATFWTRDSPSSKKLTIVATDLEFSNFSLDGDFTVATKVSSNGDGTLFVKDSTDKGSARKAKTLSFQNGKLVYEIAGVGSISSDLPIPFDQEQLVVLRVSSKGAEIYLGGKQIARKPEFSAPDDGSQVLRIGGTTEEVEKGSAASISNFLAWERALTDSELEDLMAGKWEKLNTPDITWKPIDATDTFSGLGRKGHPISLRIEGPRKLTAWAQPLDSVDHVSLSQNLRPAVMKKGETIYNSLCVTCHGTPSQEGSLPTSLKFHEQAFKNGNDPFRMYQTLANGYGMMVPQAQYSAEEKYAVIHYIREAFVKPYNPSQYFEVSSAYLESLPQKGRHLSEEAKSVTPAAAKPYEKMDFGNALMWTYQVDRESDPVKANIAKKGIAVRLDQGPGGVSKGKAWAVYDHDTMRIAATWTGDFVDWKGIAFDGSHGTHTSIAGQPLFVNPDQPAFGKISETSKGLPAWNDDRVIGRDGKRYGPVNKATAQFRGLYFHEDKVILSYTVNGKEVLEMPRTIEYGQDSIFYRMISAPAEASFLERTKLSQFQLNTSIKTVGNVEAASMVTQGDDSLFSIDSDASGPLSVTLAVSNVDQATLDSLTPDPVDLRQFTHGGPRRFPEIITTRGDLGDNSAPFAVDTLPIPNLEQNPWHSWMRIGGFDFFPENPDRAAVCTWMGDVWLVDGVAGDLSELRWQRICSGLFQPLGLKIVDGHIFVTCRDQLAKLHDLNGDDEIDFVECFNNDHQVTEHFHEFAMGLQTDQLGNFYYAKSARHALPAVVPHHGTLLRISADGSRTDIVANGFRAANGVCLNPDGTWIVTDQEGHWNPKNRINYVKEGGFYGNMYGYHDVTNESDDAMEQPLCWITNSFDRSPAELVWVPENSNWGTLRGTLLNLSYGYGKVYTVPHEIKSGQPQGGMCALPIDPLPTGIHRGRFHPENGQLYAAGMFAWAGNQQDDGGFFRIRKTDIPAWLPTKMEASGKLITITFSDPLPPGGTAQVKSWDLERTKRYGSEHLNERSLAVKSLNIQGNQAVLDIPDLQPTWGMEIVINLGNGEERVIHNSIYHLE